MDICPPEIWDKICAFSCTDDGRTGRSLSLASRSFSAISKPYKFQSVAVINRTQILAFAALLERTPPPLRRVISIYISYRNDGIEDLLKQTVQDFDVCRAMACIFTAIAPSVKVVHTHIVCSIYDRLPVLLPVLEELVVNIRPVARRPKLLCPRLHTETDADIALTALKCLKLAYRCSPRELFDGYLAQAPNATHLSFHCDFSAEIQRWLAVHLTGNDGDGRCTLPRRLEKLYIHPIMPPSRSWDRLPGLWKSYKRTTQLLKDFATTDERVVLMPRLEYPGSPVSSQTAMSMWTATAEGHNWWEQ